MLYARKQSLFENRFDAGRKVAVLLSEYKGRQVTVLAIPNGGVPIGLSVAMALDADFDVVISRKIPFPLKPEAGFGAIAHDGTPIINDEVVKQYNLTDHQINYAVNQVREEIRRRTNIYRANRPMTVVKGKTVIIADDGLASGFTMKAAVEAVRRRQPKEIIAAVPAASQEAMERLKDVADKIYTCAIGTMPKFFIADFYNVWYDFTDKEVKQCLDQWRMRNLNAVLGSSSNGKKEKTE